MLHYCGDSCEIVCISEWWMAIGLGIIFPVEMVVLALIVFYEARKRFGPQK